MRIEMPSWQRSTLFIAGLLLSALLIVLIRRAAFPTPFSDELALVRLYSALARGDLPDLRELFAALNGHPYLVLKALISATLLTGLPWTWMMYAQVVVLAASAYFVLRYRRDAGLAASMGVLFILLTPRQWENLYWAMQLAFPLFLFSSLMAFIAIGRFYISGSRADAFIGLALALVASLSNGAGIFTLALASTAVLIENSSRRNAIPAMATLVAGGLLFLLSQSLSPGSGLGSRMPQIGELTDHALRMAAHQFVDLPVTSVSGLAVGTASLAAVVLSTRIALHAWRENIFELLCISLGLILVAGVTAARVSVGIIQPDASRYLPLLAPLTIGSILLAERVRQRWLVWTYVAIIILGYFYGAWFEWGASTSRQSIYRTLHAELCLNGRVPLAWISSQTISDLQKLFCNESGEEARVVTHGNIAQTPASGFYREDDHTWIAPEFSVRAPSDGQTSSLILRGWIPDLSKYAGGQFEIQIYTDGRLIKQWNASSAGEFLLHVQLDQPVSRLTVTGSRLRDVGPDVRSLSWILLEVRFE